MNGLTEALLGAACILAGCVLLGAFLPLLIAMPVGILGGYAAMAFLGKRVVRQLSKL